MRSVNARGMGEVDDGYDQDVTEDVAVTRECKVRIPDSSHLTYFILLLDPFPILIISKFTEKCKFGQCILANS